MQQTEVDPVQYNTLVQNDRVHTSLYTDPHIFTDELEKIFYHGWVFIGHDSEVPQPGDFITRHVGTQPVIMVRGKDHKVSVLLNRCAHHTVTQGTERVVALKQTEPAFREVLVGAL